MAKVRPFKGLRYNSELQKNLSEVVVPPYDVISPEELLNLKRINPKNFSHVILSDGENKYLSAKEQLSSMMGQKVLVRDSSPAFYFYEQSFELKDSELFCQKVKTNKLVRRSFFATVGVEEYSNRIILPHEHTFSGPKADRYKLTDATQGNMEPIFLGYDSQKFSGDDFKKLIGKTPPIVSYDDIYGVQHRLWSVPETGVVSGFFDDVKLYILDGHHRYETALNYYRDHNDKSGRPSYQFVMAAICPFRQEGTVILPTHRAVTHSKVDFEGFQNELSSVGIVRKLESLSAVEKALMESKKYSFGMMGVNESYAIFESNVQVSEEKLDLDILHEQILVKDPNSIVGDKIEIDYVKDIDDLKMGLKSKKFQFCILVRPCSIDQVIHVAETSGKMPHKSTFFFPKIPSGLLINLFD